MAFGLLQRDAGVMDQWTQTTRCHERRSAAAWTLTGRTTATVLTATLVGIGIAILLAGVSAGLGWALLVSGLALASQIFRIPQTDRRSASPTRPGSIVGRDRPRMERA
jgi:hypothetical protein